MAFMEIAEPDRPNIKGLDTALEHVAWPTRRAQTKTRMIEQSRVRSVKIRALLAEQGLVAN